MKRKTNPRGVESLDKFAGARIRQARVMAQLSQSELGAKLGVSFQQIQKYEKGVNRVSASRLTQIATTLGRPLSWFYDAPEKTADFVEDQLMTRMLSTRSGLKLAENFLNISIRAQQQLVELGEVYRKAEAA